MKVACLAVFLCTLWQAESYKTGPPPEACEQMFPTGHEASAQTSTSPVTITTSANVYNKNDKITVTVTLSNTNIIPYFKGIFIQARRANCGHAKKYEPVGTWELINSNDAFLKLFTCNGVSASAISHKTASHQTKKEMKWVAPNSNEGPIYFTATIVRNKGTFWTNVRSSFIKDNSNLALATAYCDLQTNGSATSGIQPSLVMATIMAAILAFQQL